MCELGIFVVAMMMFVVMIFVDFLWSMSSRGRLYCRKTPSFYCLSLALRQGMVTLGGDGFVDRGISAAVMEHNIMVVQRDWFLLLVI